MAREGSTGVGAGKDPGLALWHPADQRTAAGDVDGAIPAWWVAHDGLVAHLAGVVLGYLAGFDVGFWFTNYPFSDTIKAPPGFGFTTVML